MDHGIARVFFWVGDQKVDSVMITKTRPDRRLSRPKSHGRGQGSDKKRLTKNLGRSSNANTACKRQKS